MLYSVYPLPWVFITPMQNSSYADILRKGDPKNMKKIIAVLMSALLLVGVLSACGGNETATPTESKTVSTPIAAGMLVLHVNGAVNISYDADGLVLNIEGADENGSILVGEYENYLGNSCSETICELISNSAAQGLFDEFVNYVMIKLAHGSALPGATFMETIQKDAEAAVAEVSANAKLLVLTEENLDEDGYINLEAAKDLLLAHLASDDFDVLEGEPTPSDGLYSFRITIGDLEGSFLVDAVTGVVCEGDLAEDSFLEDEADDLVEITDPTEGENVDVETTAGATEPSQDVVEDPAIDPNETEPAVEPDEA